MKQKISIYAQGFCISILGILLIILKEETLNTYKYMLLATFIPAILFGMIASVERVKQKVQFIYQELHSLSLIVYILLVLIFCNDFDSLNQLSAGLFLFFTFSEIIFCNWLFNMSGEINYKTLVMRISLGLISGIGGVIILGFSIENQHLKFLVFGILFLLIGISIMLYKPIIRQVKIANP